ncbi:MAG: hypothetical protein JXA67_17475 [Micromonosporaceae bacterium]|nr:hypothetical protein [Micromonosporaceae bacterium]
MKQRWLPVGVLAGALFAVNVVARLAVRLFAGKDDGKQIWIGLIALIAVSLVTLGAAVWWSPRRPMARVAGDIAVASLVGCLLSVLLGPLVSKGEAFGGGFGYVIQQLFYYLTICGLGGLLGALGVIIAGKDYKSEGWRRYAEFVQTKPKRVIRR